MEEYLFYNEYESFYHMTETSEAFRGFCREAFGEDFSQDGFSDMRQIDRILQYIHKDRAAHILDIGCGNGKMLGYLQKQTGAHIYGFDYSDKAIEEAKRNFKEKAEFQIALIGEIEYPENFFDVIISMDTMYFAKDMTAFVGQIKKWLKPDGVFFAGYQEGDVVPKTENAETSQLANALKQNGMPYTVEDITKESYELLNRKRETALKYKEAFLKEGNEQWYDMLVGQCEYASVEYEQFEKTMARYIYVSKKP